MEIGDWYLETDAISSKLVYFVKRDGVVVLLYKENRGPSGTKV